MDLGKCAMVPIPCTILEHSWRQNYVVMTSLDDLISYITQCIEERWKLGSMRRMEIHVNWSLVLRSSASTIIVVKVTNRWTRNNKKDVSEKGSDGSASCDSIMSLSTLIFYFTELGPHGVAKETFKTLERSREWHTKKLQMGFLLWKIGRM